MADYRLAKQVVNHSIKYWNSNCMFVIDEMFAQTVMSIYSTHKNNAPAGYAEIRQKSAVIREAEDKRAQLERERERRRQLILCCRRCGKTFSVKEHTDHYFFGP